MGKKVTNEFRESTKSLLAKRANFECSSPYCDKRTSGPAADEEKAINLGEAAHIRGAKKGSARYDKDMTPEERRSISNGIWLCRTCAKMIDNDEKRFRIDLLHKWKRMHEKKILKEMGAEVGAIEEFSRIEKIFRKESPPIMQLALDKPNGWEFLLTIELLRDRFTRLRTKLNDIKNGYVLCKAKSLPEQELVTWMREKLWELRAIMKMLMNVINFELPTSWGAPKVEGDAFAIKKSADLIQTACLGLIDWELEVQYSIFPDYLSKEKEELYEWADLLVDEVATIPIKMAVPFERGIENYQEETIQIELEFRMPKSAETIGERMAAKIEYYLASE